MRRSICYCEPNHALAGEVNTWKFIYTTATALPKGTLLKFDVASDGRAIDWELPDASPKASGNSIYALMENGKTLPAKEIETKEIPQYEFTLPAKLSTGESIAIIMGAPKGKKTTEKTGNAAQCMAQRRRTFQLAIDTTGKGHYDEPEIFSMDIRGNVLSNIRIITPSVITRNKRFDVTVRFEDEFGNLTNNTNEETLIELSYEHQRENLNWKLFVPETGFITLPNLYFNEEGVYTIHLKNSVTGETFKAPPIKCFNEAMPQILWGLLHGESERFDSAENIESCLRYFRDDRSLNFYSTSHFENNEETPADVWKLAIQNIAEFDEVERFTTFLGFQWVGDPNKEGVRQILFAKENKQLLRKKEPKGSSLKKIYKSSNPKELISIPIMTMADGYAFNFNNFNPEFERVVEIYNAWGSSECTTKQGNSFPIKPSGKKGVKAVNEGAIQKALSANCRFGFVAGGLDDRNFYNNFFESDQLQYSPGLTAIIVEEQSRPALFDALYRRSCYATTGARILVGLNISGTPIGGEVSTANKPGLAINRHISGYAAGTCSLKKIEIIRNGSVIKCYTPKESYHFDFTYDDMDNLELQLLKPSGNKEPPFAYYYLRVTQDDGHTAWSSPIWIDHEPLSSEERKALKMAKTAPKKAAPKPAAASKCSSVELS